MQRHSLADVRHENGPDDRFSVADRRVAVIAAAQHRVVVLAQLRDCGLSAGQIQARVRAGRLFRVHSGVYTVGLPPVTDHERWMAAVLALADAALADGSAGALLGFTLRAPVVPDVLVVRTGGLRREGLRVHTARHLDPRDLCVVDGIRATTAPRTLLDRAARIGSRALDRELRAARALGLAPDANLRDVIARHPRRAGGPALAAALLGPFTRSELERRLLASISHLPAPEVNALVAGVEVDLLWPELGLVVELDGRATHGVTAAFARDAARDDRLRALGLHVERLTWWDVVRDQRRTLERLESLMRDRKVVAVTDSLSRVRRPGR